MIPVSIEDEFKEKCPETVLGIIQCDVENSAYSEDLWKEIDTIIYNIREQYTIQSIKQQKIIAKTREVYKLTGKDPNRYRPAGEQLCRRILQGKDLYRINTLVDLVNAVSLKYGYSIGGFDADYIADEIKVGIGKAEEEYQGIGRGKLNVEGLPILRDAKGGIGTPTSDEVRTAIRPDTKHFLMNINAYTGKSDVLPVLEYSKNILKKYTKADNISITIIE